MNLSIFVTTDDKERSFKWILHLVQICVSSKIQKYNGHSYDINQAIIRSWWVYILIISVHNYMWWSCLTSYYLPRLETINGFDSRGRRDVTRRHIWRHLTSEFSAVSRYFRNGSSQKRKPMKIGEERPPKKGDWHRPGTRAALVVWCGVRCGVRCGRTVMVYS